MKKRLLLAAFLLLPAALGAQNKLLSEFKPACDSLADRLERRTTVRCIVRLRSVTKRGEQLDFSFTKHLGDIPWKKADVRWFSNNLKSLFPAAYKNLSVGDVLVRRTPLSDYAMPALHQEGKPAESRFRTEDLRRQAPPLVRQEGVPFYEKGLSGRHIAVWQSHGRYYEEKTDRWEWQRARTFTTVEDMFTQSFVLPYLIPMLENAGACVMTPRERDTQRHECVVDNDPAFAGERTGYLRRSGTYAEQGQWQDAGPGFADAKRIYTGEENPFTLGTARQVRCIREAGSTAFARWTPDLPARGKYAVYVSYKSLKNSTESARYTVRHRGGVSRFLVNQRIGGGTWIYLGTFEFDPETPCYVSLDNGTPEGGSFTPGSVVTADGVRFGGGMGKVARGRSDRPVSEYTLSGLPSYTEGALYSMQWAGVDTTVTRAHEDDYTNDFASRGAWVRWLSGGSRVNPKEPGKGIPFDLSLALHSDAGFSPNDSIIGTLAIYTRVCDGKTTYPDGGDRLAGRELADYVQTQVVQDIRAGYEPLWSRRQLWDRSYSESRTTGVPGILLEMLSHQNFADMKYGLDPSFRFTVSRAVYKGALKFLSNRYGCPYQVQPLPVHSFAAVLTDDGRKVRLSWKDTPDSLEATATVSGHILYTRVDDGAFDGGRLIETRREKGRICADIPIEKGHLYSFRIAACNDGGLSFPSETLAAGIPADLDQIKDNILIINNFYRTSPAAWFDAPERAGFDPDLDRGISDGMDISYIGRMFQFRRDLPWIDDDNPGFGASHTDEAGRQYAGNTFDYPAVHGRSWMKAGHPFCSVSEAAFSEDSLLWDRTWAADLICGKQVTTPVGRGAVPDRYTVFPARLQEALRAYSRRGGNLLVSGAHIGTDAWDRVYPVSTDSLARAAMQTFIVETLGYRWMTNYASRSPKIWKTGTGRMDLSAVPAPLYYQNEPGESCYHVETPDGLVPADPEKASTVLRYSDTDISAAVCYQGEGYKTVCFGFPLEVLTAEAARDGLTAAVSAWFRQPPVEPVPAKTPKRK